MMAQREFGGKTCWINTVERNSTSILNVEKVKSAKIMMFFQCSSRMKSQNHFIDHILDVFHLRSLVFFMHNFFDI